MNILSKLTLLCCLSVSSFAFSQLDSVAVNASFVYSTVFEESGDSLQMKSIQVAAWVNDFDFLGEIIVASYDLEFDTPFSLIKLSKAEIEAQGLHTNNTITVPIDYVEEGRSYRITVLARNFQGLNIPMVETTVLF